MASEESEWMELNEAAYDDALLALPKLHGANKGRKGFMPHHTQKQNTCRMPNCHCFCCPYSLWDCTWKVIFAEGQKKHGIVTCFPAIWRRVHGLGGHEPANKTLYMEYTACPMLDARNMLDTHSMLNAHSTLNTHSTLNARLKQKQHSPALRSPARVHAQCQSGQ